MTPIVQLLRDALETHHLFAQLGEDGEAYKQSETFSLTAAALAATSQQAEPQNNRAWLINRLQACIDDPRWPDHTQVSKKLLEACLSALVNPLNE